MELCVEAKDELFEIIQCCNGIHHLILHGDYQYFELKDQISSLLKRGVIKPLEDMLEDKPQD